MKWKELPYNSKIAAIALIATLVSDVIGLFFFNQVYFVVKNYDVVNIMSTLGIIFFVAPLFGAFVLIFISLITRLFTRSRKGSTFKLRG